MTGACLTGVEHGYLMAVWKIRILKACSLGHGVRSLT